MIVHGIVTKYLYKSFAMFLNIKIFIILIQFLEIILNQQIEKVLTFVPPSSSITTICNDFQTSGKNEPLAC